VPPHLMFYAPYETAKDLAYESRSPTNGALSDVPRAGTMAWEGTGPVCLFFLAGSREGSGCAANGFLRSSHLIALSQAPEACESGHLGDGVQHHDRDFALSLLLVISVGRPDL
jgi:hypothetical protein